LTLTGLGIWAGRVVVSITSNQLIAQMIQIVHREVDDMITFGDRMSTRMVNDIARHDISFSDPVALRRQLYGQVSDEPNVRWLACGNAQGGMTDAGRLADGTIVFLMTDDFRAGVYREYEASPDGRIGNLRKSGVYFDTREQVWYKRVRDTRARYWTEPYLGAVEHHLGVGLSAPVFKKDGSFAGVCNVKLIFIALSDFMKSLRIGDSGRAFIVDATGQLIAASGGVSPVAVGADGKEQRLQASEAGDRIVRETARHLGRHPEILEPSSSGPRPLFFDDPEGGKIYAAVDRFEAPGAIDWTIVSALPAADFLGPVYRAAYLSIAIGAFIVAVFLVLGFWAAGRALRPMTALTKAAQAIATGEWREVPAVRHNDEVGLLAQAFNRMTARLKDTLDGLRQSEARLEEAQRIAHVGYWEHDLDTDLLTWSDETYRIFGLAPQKPAITFAGLQDLIHPEDRQVAVQAAAEALRGGTRYDVEYRVVRPSGESRTVRSQSDVTRDEQGRPSRMFGTIQDITESKRAAEALRETQMELAHINRVTTMGQLMASIAHEINQPLAAIVADANASLNWLMATNPDLDQIRETLGAIVRDGHRAADVIQRIRQLATKTEPRKARLDVNDVVRDVVPLVRSELGRYGISPVVELASGLPPVLGDRVQLQQVILNLVMNGIEAMVGVGDRPRELTIRSEHDGKHVTVAVHDTGVGIDPNVLDRLFNAFFTTKPGGMGMGLSISHSIIEAHGGRLRATPGEPHGANFHFALPIETLGAEAIAR
jgi:PAS domain S-box-containing protein